MYRTVKRLAVAIAGATLVAGLALPAMASSGRATFGSVPAYATGRNFVGHASGTVTFRVVLRWRDQADLLRTIAAVSTPGSASYGHHLTPAQFRARFSPSRGDV